MDLPQNWRNDEPRLVRDNGYLEEDTDLDMPDLVSINDTDEESTASDNKHSAVQIQVGQCRDIDLGHNLPDDEDPDIAGILELDDEEDDNTELSEAHIAQWVTEVVAACSTNGKDDDPFAPMDVPALVAEWDTTWERPFQASSKSLALMASPPDITNGQLWEMYDSGASHHMTPIREDFVTFQATAPKTLTAANKQEFSADGIGDILISVPNGSTFTKIRLTSVLYTPSVGLTLVSVGRIDDAGYTVLFGNGRCEIRTGNGELIGIIPKRQAMYRVIRNTEKPSAYIADAEEVTVMDLHRRMGHIAPRAARELVINGLVTGLTLKDSDEPTECEACVKAKLTRREVAKVREGERATVFGQEIWSDLWGTPKISTLGGRKYFVSFTDDYS
jgi:hypothetical protein